MPTVSTRPRRAAAMPPDERRAAIVAATLPLVLEHGPAVSTRMIALAAGIAEGTIFRAFPDKESLLAAVIEAAFDNTPTEEALAEIPGSLPFEERVRRAVDIVQQRMATIWRLMATVGHATVRPERRRPADLAGLVALFEGARDQITYDPLVAARILRTVTLAATHPMMTAEPMNPAEITSLLLDGIRAR